MIHFIDEETIKDKTVLLRVDFNVSLNPDHTIANDERIRQTIPTITHLLNYGNRLVLVSHLGQPKGHDPSLTLYPVSQRLEKLLGHSVDFVNEYDPEKISAANSKVILLENVRFHEGEKKNTPAFAKLLASLAHVYVNDAFSVSHRPDASVVGVARLLPRYGGLLLKKEVTMLDRVLKDPQKPVVAILGGAKISTKISLVGKLLEISDYLLIGGGLANTFICATDHSIGKSMYEIEEVETAHRLLYEAEKKKTHVLIPTDAVVGTSKDTKESIVKKVSDISADEQILDIGPQTQAAFGVHIARAKTIIWNGPLGYTENPEFKRGTDFVYYAITQNTGAISVVGGGDTINAISKEEYLEKITHISTGGGAMLEYIEKGTLPGIEVLK
jgi:phosphoglycerate kinase